MSTHRYPSQALIGDYGRAAVGLALTAGPALAVPSDSAALWVLLPLALLFTVFGLRTLRRHLARVEVDAVGVSQSDWRRARLDWSQLRTLRVDYFSTRGDRTGGWMQMTLKGPGGPAGASIRLDSALDNFVAIARAAAISARDNGVALSEATRANLGHLGITVDA